MQKIVYNVKAFNNNYITNSGTSSNNETAQSHLRVLVSMHTIHTERCAPLHQLQVDRT